MVMSSDAELLTTVLIFDEEKDKLKRMKTNYVGPFGIEHAINKRGLIYKELTDNGTQFYQYIRMSKNSYSSRKNSKTYTKRKLFLKCKKIMLK